MSMDCCLVIIIYMHVHMHVQVHDKTTCLLAVLPLKLTTLGTPAVQHFNYRGFLTPGQHYQPRGLWTLKGEVYKPLVLTYNNVLCTLAQSIFLTLSNHKVVVLSLFNEVRYKIPVLVMRNMRAIIVATTAIKHGWSAGPSQAQLGKRRWDDPLCL